MMRALRKDQAEYKCCEIGLLHGYAMNSATTNNNITGKRIYVVG
ncbi:hypothetical protein [Providencia stuartii]|nr:hypothetical protein [Providencia thailandensis]